MEDVGLTSAEFVPIEACRSCGSDRLFPVLDLGEQPLANRFTTRGSREVEPRYPLATVACAGCSLVQLTGTVNPKALFEDYPYFSSFSSSFSEAARQLAASTIATRHLGPNDLVVEVGSNDGYLLEHYQRGGIPVLGIEPARNVAASARARGVPTHCDYFSEDVASKIRAERGPANVLHANNVMAHVPDVNSFVAGISALLADDGVAIIESPYVLDLVDRVEFDTIYHEHVFYYSLTAVQHVVARHGLSVMHVEHLPVHGGSIRYYVRRGERDPYDAVGAMTSDERARHVDAPSCYAGLAARVENIRVTLPHVLRERRDYGERLAAYGAAAKGTVLLNACSITGDLLEFVADRNPHKQGLCMPGVGIPIEPAEALLERRPDATLLLAWNLVDEILEEQREYRAAGGTFIVPIPEVRTVSA